MLFGKVGEKKKTSRWIVYNEGTGLEFAECEHCGHEKEPWYTDYETEETQWRETTYPNKCPMCLARMEGRIRAEEIT